MAYTVLARKHRSKTFDEIVGQDAIAITLKNAVTSGRIHHGYLFTGTRGVGKTSMARILAKSLNCLAADGPTVTPCCQCDACERIAEGEDVDVIEIDAASNTGVDNIRELRSNAIYRPARSRFKIYIIDEVHMLSTGAFNALLKTLEEPPEHVKFVFATTEPQKVPPTIQSRCQRFDFRSIPSEIIAKQLEMILASEAVQADPAALRRIARLANGSMRDGLSLLDQLLSLGESKLTTELIDEVLPAPHDELLADLIDRVADNDAAGALEAVEQSLAGGHTLERFCESLIDQLRSLMLLTVCGPQTELVDVPRQVRERLIAQSQKFDGATYVYMITILEELRRNVRFSGAGRALTDAAIVRLAEAKQFTSVASLLSGLGGTGTMREEPAESGQAGRGDAKRPAVPARSAEHGRIRNRRGASEPKPRALGSPRSEAPATQAPVTAPAGAGQVPAETEPGAQPKTGAARTPRIQTPPTPRAGGSSIGSEELKAAVADPLVRRAMDLFDGSLANVERHGRQAGSRERPKQS